MNDNDVALPSDVIESAKRFINKKSPETVLGHREHDYLGVARRSVHHANHFDIGPAWGDLQPAQQWAANRLVLDHTIDRSHVVRLAAPRSQIRPGSGLDREVKYLIEHGYRFRSDQDEDLYIVPMDYPQVQPKPKR